MHRYERRENSATKGHALYRIKPSVPLSCVAINFGLRSAEKATFSLPVINGRGSLRSAAGGKHKNMEEAMMCRNESRKSSNMCSRD
ncbi:hypothetical protein ILYODFUR_009268 [Ilyodon furcidens]|uniref:Uncharacterized protein n=1 Tax=Ilyodon furcidens TaxID=33524 RepID=A0ABV0UF43_9TELE